MSGLPRYRAWRFLHPDFDAPETSAGLQIDHGGRVAMVEKDASIRQSILLLFSTAPGERVMRPEYGCDLEQLVFAGNDETTAGLAIHLVRRVLVRWEPRVEVTALDARWDEARPGHLEILLDYRVRATQRADQLVFPLNLLEGT